MLYCTVLYCTVLYCTQGMAARNQRIARLGGCLWWHFYPHQTTRDLEAKYRQILRANNKSDALQ